MREKRSNALLAELLAVVLFFALCAAVLVRLFGAAYEKERNAGFCAEALAAARSIAEEVYAAQDAEALLPERGFQPDADGAWTLAGDGWELKAVTVETRAEQGTLREAAVRILVAGEQVGELDATRFLPEGGAQ